MTAPFPSQDRLRFAEFELDRLPNGRCRARVVLSWQNTDRYTGESEGLASQSGELRCAAEATVEALGKAVDNAMRFELLGVKAVRAFDATVVIVSLTVHGDKRGQRLIGSYLADDDFARGSALAVLHATNRILGNKFFMR